MLNYIIATLMMLSGSTLAEFVTTPTSFNATLGSTATFNCSVSSGSVGWIINGSLLSHQITPDITTSGGGTTSSLHVPAIEKYNNMTVTCIIFTIRHDLSEELLSGPVVLRIQGLLEAVSDLRTENLGEVIRLTWDAPPSLDITGVDIDIQYRVDITVGGDPFNTYFVNTTEFNFTQNSTNTSVIYKFRVTAINGAGNGSMSAPVTGYFIGSPRSVATEMVGVEVSIEPLSVNFTIEFGYIPPGEMPDRFQVHAETVDGGDKVLYCSDDIHMTPDSDGRVFLQLDASGASDSGGLMAYRNYTTTIAAKNDFGESNSTGEILFSTHEVQTCEINNCSDPGTVKISCTFSEGSKAKGYLSILCPDDNSPEMFVVANRDDMSTSGLRIRIPGLPRDKFDVVVFDFGESGRPPGDINYAAEEETVYITDPGKSEDNELVTVNGTSLHVPDTANGEVNLCISSESIANTDMAVVLAYQWDNPKKLLAYFLNATANCARAPDTGDYIFGVFTQNGDNILKAPATPPTISFDVLPIMSPIPSTLPTISEIDHQSSVVVVAVTASILLMIALTLVLIAAVLFVRSKTKKASGMISHADESSKSVFLSCLERATCSKTRQEQEEAAARIMADCGTNPPPTYTCHASAKPSLQYASLDSPDVSKVVPPPTDMIVSYSVIEHGGNANQPIHYADLDELPGTPNPPPKWDDNVQYQTIKPPAQVADSAPPLPVKRHVTGHPPSTPVNFENLFDALHPAVTPKWKQLAEVVRVDEYLIDEIFTNNNGIDEECLKDTLDVWLKKSSPTWKGVADAAQKTGENQLAESLYHKHKYSGRVETPRMTQSLEKPLPAAEKGDTPSVLSLWTKISPIEPPHQTSPSDKCETTTKIITKQYDTSCTPAKSPVVDEGAFQEPSSHVNHSLPDGKLIDGKEVPLAENDTFAGESEDAMQEEEKERNPSHLAERHAQKTLTSKKTDKLCTNFDPVAFSVHHMSCEEVSEAKKEHILDQADGYDEAANHSTDIQGSACFTSELLYSHTMRMWPRRQIPLLTDGYVLPTSSTTFCYSMPFCEVARTRTSQSEPLGCNKASSVIYLTPVECISEEETTSAYEVVGPEIGLGITVQDKDVEETSLDRESPCADETKVPQEGDVAVNKDPDEKDMAADNYCEEPYQREMAVGHPHKEPHQGDAAAGHLHKEPHQGDAAAGHLHKEPHQGDAAAGHPRKEPHQGDTAVDNPRKEPHQGDMAFDNLHKEPHQGDAAAGHPHKEPHQGDAAAGHPHIETPHQGDTAVDNPRKEPHQGDGQLVTLA